MVHKIFLAMANSRSDRRGLQGWAKHLFAAVYLVTMSGCRPEQPGAPPAATTQSPPHEDATLDELLGLMRERLLLMHDVAKWKWNEGQPIADADREQQLLADLEQRGLAYGLSRERTRAFMAAQIEAGKLMQEADFATWKKAGQGKFSDVRDLATDLRPRIDELSDRMLAQLAKVAPMIGDEQARTKAVQRADAVVRGNGIDDDVRAVVIRPLLDGLAD